MGGIQNVSTPVAEGAHAEIVPAAPLSVDVVLVVIVETGRHQPGVPVERLRDRLSRRETFDVRIPAVPATRRVHVGGDRRNVLDDSGVFPCLELEIIPFGVALVAHLVDYLVLFCRFHHQLDLVERACHRLLGIDVLAERHRQHTDREVREVRNPDRNGVDLVAHLVEHLPEILEARHVRELLQRLFGVRGPHVYVAQRDDVGLARFSELAENFAAPVADPADGQVDPFVRADDPRFGPAADNVFFVRMVGRAAAADSAKTLFRNSRLENSLESIFQLFVSVMIGFFSLSYR